MPMKAECPYLAGCPMFKYFKLEATKQVFIIQYCRGYPDECERKKMRESGKPVPEKLLPDGKYWE